MSVESSNKQYSSPGPMFGGGDYASSGADGTAPMAGQADSAMAPVTIPFTNTTYEGHGGTAFAAQVTEGFSGQGADAMASTGAGKGSNVMNGHHPNSNPGV